MTYQNLVTGRCPQCMTEIEKSIRGHPVPSLDKVGNAKETETARRSWQGSAT